MAVPDFYSPRQPSLRRQLLAPLLWVWLFGVAVAAGGAYVVARYAGNAAFDRALQDEAGAIATQVTWGEQGPSIQISRQTLELMSWDVADRNSFMVVDEDGQVLAGAGDLPMPPARTRNLDKTVLFDATYLKEPVRGALVTVASPMLDQLVTVVVVETTRKRAQLVREVQWGAIGPTLALGTLTFVLLAWGIRRGVAPLREVIGEVERRDAHDLRPLPLAAVPREILPLIERINTLLGNVRRSIDGQRRFVADAAHQLRTPVAGLRVLVQELQHELQALPPGGWSQLTDALALSTDRMARLIAQLLRLARAEAALTDVQSQQVLDVTPVLRSAAEPLVLQAVREGRNIALEAPPQPCLAWAHPVWLGEIVNNLLDNALRYGGPNIELRIEQDDAGVHIGVHDDGPGIPPEHLAHVFEPFWRGDRADRRNDDGSGLGLAIAREVSERLGGRLTVASAPEITGTCFSLHLRRAQEA
ncbi:sensor histidine kinase [Methylibium rhizosphaerae]|uniref:sensor histidine kinase n=1 Tax=Methylibium rhizosphaerae TaxID=2570323 RepID=UPI001127EB28|nr:sensor histidine kinase [Methylibium rhizosphaerae]